MRKFFENPEMVINVFDVENVVTTSLTPQTAKDAISEGKITLQGMGTDSTANAKATAIIAFK